MRQKELRDEYNQNLVNDVKQKTLQTNSQERPLPGWIALVALAWWAAVMLILSHYKLGEKVDQGQAMAGILQILLEAGVLLLIDVVFYKRNRNVKGIVLIMLVWENFVKRTKHRHKFVDIQQKHCIVITIYRLWERIITWCI